MSTKRIDFKQVQCSYSMLRFPSKRGRPWTSTTSYALQLLVRLLFSLFPFLPTIYTSSSEDRGKQRITIRCFPLPCFSSICPVSLKFFNLSFLITCLRDFNCHFLILTMSTPFVFEYSLKFHRNLFNLWHSQYPSVNPYFCCLKLLLHL